jgi:hypothetical protein
MRILILDTCYPAFLELHYARNPGLGDRSYDDQWRSIMSCGFGTADAYSHYLQELGHPAHEVLLNCLPLQRQWLAEHRIGARRSWFGGSGRTLGKIARAQAAEFEPDVIYVQDLKALTAEELRALRKTARLLVGQLGTEAPDGSRLEAFDLVTTSFPHFVPWLRGLGVDSAYFRIGFDARAIDRIETSPRAGVVFVGSLLRPRWEQAIDRIADAAEQVEIDFYGYGVESWPESSAVRRRYHGEAWGNDMLRLVGRARIALNRHGDVAGEYANNMRLYEATGMGALLVTDDKTNLGDLFDVGGEIVVYRDSSELVDRIHYYLEHEDERARIAAAGQRRTLSEHTYEVRMQELVSILTARMS